MSLSLSGKRIFLRALESRDLPHLLEAYQDLDLQLKTDGDSPPVTDVQVNAFWQEIITDPGADLRYFAIEPLGGNPGSGQMIGACSFQHIDMRNRHAELGIFMISDQWRGQGYGKEAVNLLLNYGFEVVRLDKIYLGVYDFNEAGLRLYERVGFRYEGRLRQMIYYEGRYWDEWPMRMLRSEWEAYCSRPGEGIRALYPDDYERAIELLQRFVPLPNGDAAHAYLRRWWRQIDREVCAYQVNGELVGILTVGGAADDTPTPIDIVAAENHRDAIKALRWNE